jgi:hypothetical protein
MRVGTIGYATESGLGLLIQDFYKNKVITDILVQTHNSFLNHFDWYPGAPVLASPVGHLATEEKLTVESFVREIDILFLFESYWHPQVIDFALQYKKPIVLMPMYEWSPGPIPANLFITPSLLDHQYYLDLYPNARVEQLNVPVSSNVIWRERKSAVKFIHNAGNGSSNDRNGTLDLIKAMEYVKSPIELEIRAQALNLPEVSNPKISIINKTLPFDQLWSSGDVFIFVERFAGLSMPLQEAFASGMAIIAGDRFPLNQWLPLDLLIKPVGHETLSFNGLPTISSQYDVKQIAAMIDSVYGMDLAPYSNAGALWAKQNSWDEMRPKYLKLIASLI